MPKPPPPPQNSPVEDSLVSYRQMFEREVGQATGELRRPAHGLLVSGVLAGLGVGTSLLLVAAVHSALDGVVSPAVVALIAANAYAVGFIIAILGRTDLFTEYTTIAIFPVLTGHARLPRLLRLWGLIYVGNLAGGAVVAILLVTLGPRLGIVEEGILGQLAGRLAHHGWWVVLLSGVVAGWLMGMLSWLIAGGRDTISQIVFIWMIGLIIGVCHLHHAITGGIEMAAGMLSHPQITLADLGHVLGWTTLGNLIGGVIFALLARQAAQLTPEPQHGERSRPRRERDTARSLDPDDQH